MKKSLFAQSYLYFVCLSIVSVIPFSGCSPSETERANPLVGAWRMTSHVSFLVDGTKTDNKPQENLLLFSEGYYSMAFARGDEPSPAYAEKFSGTDEEKLARMNAITVNTGSYTVSGSTATLRPIIAKVPELSGGSIELEYELSGDVLVLKWRRIHSAEGVEQPFHAEGNRNEATLVRITGN